PHDNNIGQRNVTPVPFKNNKLWLKELSAMSFTLKNPFREAAKMVLDPTIPRLLEKAGWKLEFATADGKPIKRATLKLGPGESTQISMQLTPGQQFAPAELAKARDALIRIDGYANDIIIGGMTFPIAPEKQEKQPQ